MIDWLADWASARGDGIRGLRSAWHLCLLARICIAGRQWRSLRSTSSEIQSPTTGVGGFSIILDFFLCCDGGIETASSLVRATFDIPTS